MIEPIFDRYRFDFKDNDIIKAYVSYLTIENGNIVVKKDVIDNVKDVHMNYPLIRITTIYGEVYVYNATYIISIYVISE